MDKFFSLASSLYKLSAKVGLPVVEQAGFSLYSFVALGLVWAHQQDGSASIELAAVSALHLSIPFLALTYGWERNNRFNRAKLFAGRENLMLSLVTIVWAVLILWGLAPAIDVPSIIVICIGAYAVTIGAATRWHFLNHKKYLPLIFAALLSAAVFAGVAIVARGHVALPVLWGLVASRIAYMVLLLPFARSLPREEDGEVSAPPVSLSVNKIGLALMQYLRQNGAVPLAAFFIPEAALVLGRLYQLFGNLVRMALVPIGNLLFFGGEIQPRQFLLVGLLVVIAGGAVGIASEVIWFDTGNYLVWVLVCMSAFASYAALLACRVTSRSNLALVSETGAVVAMLAVLAVISQNLQSFAYAIIVADVLAAVIVFTRLSARKTA